MKKSTVTMLAMLFVTFSFAQKTQEKNVPANVKSTIQKNYPAANPLNGIKRATTMKPVLTLIKQIILFYWMYKAT